MIFFFRQLKDKYMYTEHYNNQQNIPELLKAILHQNANVFRGPPPIFQQHQGNSLLLFFKIKYTIFILSTLLFYNIFCFVYFKSNLNILS